MEKRTALPLPEGELVILDSEVVRGKRLGRTLGFPTANQLFAEGDRIPRLGIYASTAEIDGREYIAVSNIGTRPTVDGEGVNCETHVIECELDLYAKRIRVVLRAYLRPEQRFSSVEELRRTIAGDVECAKEYFKQTQV
jgi:riboflavin kinase/FMN adenylyltransferase